MADRYSQNTQDQRLATADETTPADGIASPLHPLVIFFERGDSMLEEGDIIELKEGMRVYAEVPEHFLYSNRRGVRPAGAAGRQAMSAKIQPVAWAVYADSFGDDGPAVCKHREVSERLAREVGGRLVPLLAPDFAPQAPDFAPQAPDNGNATLTDAEREAVDMAIDLLNGVEDVSAGASSRADAAAATLRGLLERLK